jgi:hypothetical protein
MRYATPAIFPLIWKPRHVKGHQDSLSYGRNLDIYAQLNVEMDATAKRHMSLAKMSPWHHYTSHEPWSLWFSGKKLIGNLDNII